MRIHPSFDPDRVTWDERGLVPAVAHDPTTGRVLMVAWMNREALDATLDTGLAHFWSRSRNRLWQKGETSGNHLQVSEVRLDCDGDTLLVEAHPAGPVCHTGTETCFGDTPAAVGFGALDSLWSVISQRKRHRPQGSYTVHLLDHGPDLPARKLIEEAAEVALAAKDHALGNADDRRVAEEIADLLYHLLVLTAERGVDPNLVLRVLADRAG